MQRKGAASPHKPRANRLRFQGGGGGGANAPREEGDARELSQLLIVRFVVCTQPFRRLFRRLVPLRRSGSVEFEKRWFVVDPMKRTPLGDASFELLRHRQKRDQQGEQAVEFAKLASRSEHATKCKKSEESVCSYGVQWLHSQYLHFTVSTLHSP
jgi:hypothetical protein